MHAEWAEKLLILMDEDRSIVELDYARLLRRGLHSTGERRGGDTSECKKKVYLRQLNVIILERANNIS